MKVVLKLRADGAGVAIFAPEASIINTDLIPAVMGIVTLAIFAPILVIWVQTRRWSPLEEYRREQK